MKKNIDDALRSQLFPLKSSKAQRTQFSIIKAAIKTYAKVGFENATFEKIAATGNISRPLIMHYFKSKEELFGSVSQYIRAHFQELAIEHLLKGENAEEQLKNYIHACFLWVKDFPNHARIWLLFFFFCGVDKKQRKLHSEITAMGQQRIAAILDLGVEKGFFKSTKNLENAKLIQMVITGALVNLITEEFVLPFKVFEERTINLCLNLVR